MPVAEPPRSDVGAMFAKGSVTPPQRFPGASEKNYGLNRLTAYSTGSLSPSAPISAVNLGGYVNWNATNSTQAQNPFAKQE